MMSATTYGWLVLLFPLLGTLVIGFGFRVLPGRRPAGSARPRSAWRSSRRLAR